MKSVTTRLSSLPDFRRLWFVGFASFLVRWLEMLAYGLFAWRDGTTHIKMSPLEFMQRLLSVS